MDWAEVLPPAKCSYIMGNPPFVGKKEQTPRQKSDLEPIFAKTKGAGVLDYVTAWHAKAVEYIKANPSVPVAFVSTNSICQGEQVGVLWPWLLAQGVKIQFAHRAFRWSNEGRGVAAVHCVIVGFGLQEAAEKWLFTYETPKSEPTALKAKRINHYLVDAPDVTLEKRKHPLSNAPSMNYGSMPIDGGHLILSESEKDEILNESSTNQKYIREYMGGDEFINSQKRWCLWLPEAEPREIKNSALITERVRRTRNFRSGSGREATKKLSNYPTIFGEIRQPSGRYLLLPKVSSENRTYMPIGFISPDVIANGSALIVPNARLFHFGILSSHMHNAWMRTVCGRMKSDYQYSAGIVYNNFPWPTPTATQQAAIETKAQAVLDARAACPDSALADLYDPLAMPPGLAKAHARLDKAVDTAYGYQGGKDDAPRVAFLFARYQKLVAPPPAEKGAIAKRIAP
jgi:hypothetical protein